MDLASTAAALCAKGKGLLASDESTGTIGKRLEKAALTNDEETRRAYRELFYTAPVGDYYSGAILFKETLTQAASDGTPFVECLTRQGILPGIKVDEGLVPIAGSAGETSTRGLEALADSCRVYVQQGARFAKWRAALKVDKAAGCPSEAAVQLNAEQLAEYAAVCQACGLVPVVEPEILIDGPHTLADFGAVSERVIGATIAALWRRGVVLEAALLKPQMVVQGADCPGPKPSSKAVAEATLRVMRRVVPPALPGIMFLSGGQTEEEATVNLNTINRLAQEEGRAPWALSFSFGRALQASVLQLWSEGQRAGGARAVEAAAEARAMAAALARANSAAGRGGYSGPHPSLSAGGAGTLREDFRGWRTDVPGAAPAPPAAAAPGAGV